MARGLFYDKKTDKFVHVAKTIHGEFSFFRTKTQWKAGVRIKGLRKYDHERIFDTKEQADKALPGFAKKKSFIFLDYDGISQRNRSKLIRTYNGPW